MSAANPSSAATKGSAATQARLWYAQRISAMVLVLCVLVHLATMLVAVRGGLSAAEILDRTRGSALAALFYGVFVLSAAVHAPIGLAKICQEWLNWRGRSLAVAMALLAAMLCIAGVAAIWGLVGG